MECKEKCIILVYTSLLFGITVIHAAFKQNIGLVILMTGLMGFSLINHGKRFDEFKGKQTVRLLDIAFAHLVVTFVLYLNFYKSKYSWITWLTYFCISYVGLVYLLYIRDNPNIQPYLHATMHIAGILGSNLVLI